MVKRRQPANAKCNIIADRYFNIYTLNMIVNLLVIFHLKGNGYRFTLLAWRIDGFVSLNEHMSAPRANQYEHLLAHALSIDG